MYKNIMNILHVMLQYEVTGSEVYVASLVEEQYKMGHTIFVISDTISMSMHARYVYMPIDDRTYFNRIKIIYRLIQFINQHNIQCVHAHARAASYVSYFAAKLTGIAYISTIHGKQFVHSSSRSFNVYGKHIIAICENLKFHLVNELRIPESSIHIIRNCFDPLKWKNENHKLTAHNFGSDRRKNIVFVGRYSGHKKTIIEFLIYQILPVLIKRINVHLTVVGGKTIPPTITEFVKRLNAKFGESLISLVGFQIDVRTYYEQADIVIGSGRVATEALMMGKPLLIFGESGYQGLGTLRNISELLGSNFGDIGEKFKLPQILSVVSDIISVLNSSHPVEANGKLMEFIRKEFDSIPIFQNINNVYRKAISSTSLASHIPVFLYHRVIDNINSAPFHGIWVSTRIFERQLQSLKRWLYQTITFRDYQMFLDGKYVLPEKPIILTFDDGYEDNYNIVFPLLKKYGFKAVIFPVMDLKRRYNFWDSEEQPVKLLLISQMQEMNRFGFEFGSHTLTHSDLTMLPSEKILWEVSESKKILEKVLGHPVISFAYPYGRVTENAKIMVKKAGYEFATAVNSGPLILNEDFLEIRRRQVFPKTSIFGFWKKTQRWYGNYKNALTNLNLEQINTKF